MAFEQLATNDGQHYAGVRTAGSSSVCGSTHLYVPEETGRIQITSTPLPNQTTQTRVVVLDECSTLGELLRTELNDHKDVLHASYTTGETAEYTLTIEVLTKTSSSIKAILQEICRKINMEVYELFQDLQKKEYKRIQLSASDPKHPLILRGKIKRVRTSLVNALRRTILEDLPCLAIHTVAIKESKSILDDGHLADRLSLVPIDCTDIDSLIHKDDCLCDSHCSKCSAVLTLKEKHPANSGSLHHWMVTDLDFIPDPHHKSICPAVQSQTIPDEATRFKQRINLAPLMPGQEIDIQAIVKLGIGRQHAKFKPACRVIFVPNRHVQIHVDVIDELKLNQADLAWFVDQCPTKVFALSVPTTNSVSPNNSVPTNSVVSPNNSVPTTNSVNNENKHAKQTQEQRETPKLVVTDPDRCMACQACTVASKTLINKRMPEPEVTKRMADNTLKPIATYEVFGQDDSQTDFRFAIQSVGGMMPLQILTRSMNVLVQRLMTFSRDLSLS